MQTLKNIGSKEYKEKYLKTWKDPAKNKSKKRRTSLNAPDESRDTTHSNWRIGRLLRNSVGMSTFQ